MFSVCEGMDYFAMYYGGYVFKLKQYVQRQLASTQHPTRILEKPIAS
jgi:hypothetical protein